MQIWLEKIIVEKFTVKFFAENYNKTTIITWSSLSQTEFFFAYAPLTIK